MNWKCNSIFLRPRLTPMNLPAWSPNTNFYNTFGVYKNTNLHCICTTFVNYHRLTFLCKTVLFSCVSCTDSVRDNLWVTFLCKTFLFSCVSCTDSVSGVEDISVQDILCGRHFCAGHFVWKTFLFRQNCVEDISVQAKLCGRHFCAGHFVRKTNRTSVWSENSVEDICVSCLVSCTEGNLCGRQIERVCESENYVKTFVYHVLSRACMCVRRKKRK